MKSLDDTVFFESGNFSLKCLTKVSYFEVRSLKFEYFTVRGYFFKSRWRDATILWANLSQDH